MSEFIKVQGIQAEEESMVLEALSLAAQKNVDFVDAFLGSSANNQNNAVATFDRNDFGRLNVDWESAGEI